MMVVGLLMIAAGVALPFIMLMGGWHSDAYKYIYAVGAVMLFASRVLSPYRGPSLRLKRLTRLESWSGAFFCVAAFFLFYPPGNNLRDVLAFTLAGAAIQCYASIMIPRISKKENKS